MDMITKVQVEDAVKNHGIVEARVKTVAGKVGNIRGEFTLPRGQQPTWHLTGFSINNRQPREGMEHLHELAVSTHWVARVADPEDCDTGHTITRTVQFPIAYLLQDGWEAREQTKARNLKRWFARHHIEALAERLNETDKELVALRLQFAATCKLANEKDEDVPALLPKA